ncbi:hypothetical protein DIURU_000665 [Diutina rugosa]|uniref:NADH dehydrogenase (Ubiquinone) complex I, assembly factor 6 n=1 Tax=Diutina rugosa TaxID=5481 RepID=A0A642UWV7_DIURU|nr:uncharacterized protein DIURU_000665 [Diutina rugosa]KAA8906981.1 hypothetical protein DIURU_000665 [Diutina rugosa]
MVRIRRYTTSAAIHNAVENVSKLLETHDRSSYVLAQYIPEPARPAFLATRAFNIEINKINDGGSNLGSVKSQASSAMSRQMGASISDLKFKFWSDTLHKVFAGGDAPAEPIALLLRDSLENDINLNIDHFLRFLQTRKQFLKGSTFSTTNDICAYGEGTYSQLNYEVQAALLSPSISPSVIKLLQRSMELQGLVSDIAAHIGQATAVSSMILGMQYYAQSQNRVTLPIDLMTKNDLSQEHLLRLAQGHISNTSEQEEIRSKLKNVVFETAVTANDHILSARSKLDTIKREVERITNESDEKLIRTQSKKWKGGIPDVIFTPYMVAIPTVLYLEKLQKLDFDVFAKKMQQKEWKLGYKSFRSYYSRSI